MELVCLNQKIKTAFFDNSEVKVNVRMVISNLKPYNIYESSCPWLQDSFSYLHGKKLWQ